MSDEGDPILSTISNQLAQLTRLVALSVTVDMKQRDKILLLARAGLGRHEIAEILGTTPGTVSVELSMIKKGKKQR